LEISVSETSIPFQAKEREELMRDPEVGDSGHVLADVLRPLELWLRSYGGVPARKTDLS
jgi:hypothetical protein